MSKTDQPAGVAVDRGVRPHSPGPWSWSSDHAMYCAETEATHMVNGKPMTCAECGHDPSECGPPVLCLAPNVELAEEYEAEDVFQLPSESDKRLIAAAPDLLEALRGLLAAVQRSVCAGSGPAQAAAHAAINKAVGAA